MWCSSPPAAKILHNICFCSMPSPQSGILLVINMAEHRVSNTQLGELLDFLEANPAVAKGVGLGSRSKENIDREWENIASKLNAHGGGCTKTGLRWKRYWADLKHKVKSRAAERRREAGGTGGGPPTLDDLSETDKKVLAIIGDAAVFGDTEHRVPAFSTNSSIPGTREVNEVEIFDFDGSLDPGQIQQEIVLPHLTSPSSRGHTSRVDVNEISTSSNIQQELPPQPPHDRESPVSRPHHITRRPRNILPQTSDRESPVSRPHQMTRRPRTVLPQTTNVTAEWVIDLERRRVAAEEKQAEATLVIADALKTFVEISRMHMEAMHKILDLLKDK